VGVEMIVITLADIIGIAWVVILVITFVILYFKGYIK